MNNIMGTVIKTSIVPAGEWLDGVVTDSPVTVRAGESHDFSADFIASMPGRIEPHTPYKGCCIT